MPKATTKIGDANNAKTIGKRYYKKRYTKNTVKSLSYKLNKLQKVVMKQPERKHYDQPISQGVSNLTTLLNMSLVPEGDTEVQRTGIVINPKSLYVHFRVTAESGDANELRFIIFRWFDQTGPTVADILTPATGPFAGYLDIDVPTNFVTKPKYQILSDSKMSVDPDQNDSLFYDFKYDFRPNAKIYYAGSTGTQILKGQLYLLVTSDSGVLPHPNISGFSRLTFIDP